jgi:osmoprotectant transport system substrate-binding protein
MNQEPILCSGCGTPVPGNASFCATCGQSVKLHKRYQISEEMAKEGTCTVFKAYDTVRSNKEVVVKKFALSAANSHDVPDAEELCKHEAQILNSLNHRCIPDVHEYFSEGEFWYLVLQFMEGETLEERWQRARRRTRLSAEEILSIEDELCSLLDYLHQRSLIFVDLKPANIILGHDKHIDLIDFGSAYDSRAGRNTAFKWRVTEGYGAPELEQGKPASTRSDIYSLGAILFQLASGEKPTSNPLTSDIIDTRKLSGTPPDLVQLIAKMMHEDEQQRPQRVTDVQKELQDIKQKLQVPVNSAQTLSTGRRNFLLGGLVGVASGLVGGSALWLTLPRKNSIQFPLTVGGKLDNEAYLLSEMYFLLLQNDGFLMTDRSRLGQDDQVFDAMRTGAIDLYPEFLLTGLARLGRHTTHNQQQDFQIVENGFFQQYQMTWLDPAIALNDNFCVAIPANNTTLSGIKTLSGLAKLMQNPANTFKIAVAPDYQDTLNSLQAIYGITFPANSVLSFDELGTFTAVNKGFAQISLCYSTDPSIATNNFVRLTDNKGALPIDTPSPVIRNEVLNKEPRIAKTLQPLAQRLSTEVSATLQQYVLNGQSARDVAAQWLKQQGLL